MNLQDNIPGCFHFKWAEALYLPSWSTHHIPSPEEINNLTLLFQKLEVIKAFLGGNPINVHCTIRPILNNPTSSHNGEDYNLRVGGSSHSAHKIGLAVDFDVNNMTCDEVKAKLLPKLEEFKIRLENNGNGAIWIHVDLEEPRPNRYFLP